MGGSSEPQEEEKLLCLAPGPTQPVLGLDMYQQNIFFVAEEAIC